jgi:dTDP-4-amino-4,6-dideoxygalactose transaminase
MTNDYKYNPWPLGHIPENSQRPDLNLVKAAGYKFSDPRDLIDIFEDKVAKFAGSDYAVAVDCCSHGLFLCLKYLNAAGIVTIPKQTYISVPMQIMHAGCQVAFENVEWNGMYQLKPLPIFDSAVRWNKGMYSGGFQVLSFQIKKRIPIGKGGMILTNDPVAAEWLRKARYDGRDLKIPYPDNNYETIGWHYYMTPEDAARGILLMDNTPEINDDIASWENYPDISTHEVFRGQ